MRPFLFRALNKRMDAATLYLDDAVYSKETLSPSVCTTTITFGNNKSLTVNTDVPVDTPWLTGGVVSDYEIRVTISSGTFSSGDSTGSWLALSSNRSWTVQRSSVGSKSCTATYEIRMAASPFTVLKTATITLSALMEP